MTTPAATVPQTVTELKEAIGRAVLQDFIDFYDVRTVTSARSFTPDDVVTIANVWLQAYPAEVAELHHAAIRTLDCLPADQAIARATFLQDCLRFSDRAFEFFHGSPGNFFGVLVISAIGDDDQFRQLMELFRDLTP